MAKFGTAPGLPKLGFNAGDSCSCSRLGKGPARTPSARREYLFLAELATSFLRAPDRTLLGIEIPSADTSAGERPAIAVATGCATARPSFPETAVPIGFDEATPPAPAIARPKSLTSATAESSLGTFT